MTTNGTMSTATNDTTSAGTSTTTSSTSALRPRRFDAPQLAGEDTLRVAARHDATAERRRYDAGFHQGRSDGYAQGAADVDAAIADHRRNAERLASLCQAIEHAIAERRALDEQLLASVEQAVLEMSVRVAEAVIGREVSERDVVVDTVRRCLALDRPTGDVAVLVHPDDVECAAEAVQVGLIDRTGVQLVADARIERGGCVVDAPAVRIDGQLGPALDRVREALGIG